MSEQLDPTVIQTQKAFLRYMLSSLSMTGLDTAIALEEIASEIRQRQAAKWRAAQQH